MLDSGEVASSTATPAIFLGVDEGTTIVTRKCWVGKFAIGNLKQKIQQCSKQNDGLLFLGGWCLVCLMFFIVYCLWYEYYFSVFFCTNDPTNSRHFMCLWMIFPGDFCSKKGSGFLSAGFVDPEICRITSGSEVYLSLTNQVDKDRMKQSPTWRANIMKYKD